MTDVGEASERRAPGRRRRERASRPLWQEVTVLLVVAVLVATLLRTFIMGVYFIPSGSMENTLLIGDRVVVSKIGYRIGDIERGDIVVFNGVDSFTTQGVSVEPATNPVTRALQAVGGVFGAEPPSDKDFIKRVIGIGGDRVVCCDEAGAITVNGEPIDEPYLFPGDEPSTTRFDVIVPEGKLWVMGDHRSASADSRSHIGDPGGGFVPEDKVIGRAVAVIWPFSSFTWLS